MAHLFECPYCAAQTMVEPQFLGHSGPCAECGRVVTVPNPADQAAGHIHPSKQHQVRSSRGRWPLFAAVFFLTVLGVVIICVFVFGVIVPASKKQVVKTQTQASARNLAKLAQALRDYQKLHGSYPPAYTVNEFNQAMHSWRVLILPQLGHGDLYRRFDLSKPWDSPKNLALLRWMPPEFASPDDPTSGMTGATNYFAIRGRQSMFPGTQASTPQQIRDGLANTLMLIEVNSSVISWTQPIDYSADTQSLSDGSSAKNQRRTSSILVATADGKAQASSAAISAETRQALVSASGGEPESIKAEEQPIESD